MNTPLLPSLTDIRCALGHTDDCASCQRVAGAFAGVYRRACDNVPSLVAQAVSEAVTHGGELKTTLEWSLRRPDSRMPDTLTARIRQSRYCVKCGNLLKCTKSAPVVATISVHEVIAANAIITLSMGLTGARVMYGDERARESGAKTLFYCMNVCALFAGAQ